jgi:hypothetical protein
MVDDLHQVLLRDSKTPRHIPDRRQLTIIERDLNESTQRKIAEKRKSHYRLRPAVSPNITYVTGMALKQVDIVLHGQTQFRPPPMRRIQDWREATRGHFK